MKVYSYKNGEKAVFINNEKVMIDADTVKMIREYKQILINHIKYSGKAEGYKKDLINPTPNAILNIAKKTEGFDFEAKAGNNKFSGYIVKLRNSDEIIHSNIFKNGKNIDLQTEHVLRIMNLNTFKKIVQ